METEDRKSVLIVNTVGMGYQGMSSVILNYMKHMSADGLDLHIVAPPDVDDAMRMTLENLGTVHIVPRKKENLKGYLAGLNEILKSGMDVIHIHGNSGTMAMEAALAKLHAVKKIIVHAHNTKTSHPLINAVMKHPMMALADIRMACSDGAGKWLYGRREYTVLNNAIDLSRFRFDSDSRKRYRAELGIEEEFLVGHIGHFTAQKNHFYLIDIFDEFHKLAPNSKLLLVSDGPRFEQVKQKVAQLNLQDAVIFAGRRADADRLYQAMDAFILPSCWEGLPLVALEAQACGLPVLASDRITRDIQCTDRLSFLSIDEPAELWAQRLVELTRVGADRTEDLSQQLRRHGFDIEREAEKLRALYLA